jgi:hypothetical protein
MLSFGRRFKIGTMAKKTEGPVRYRCPCVEFVQQLEALRPELFTERGNASKVAARPVEAR